MNITLHMLSTQGMYIIIFYSRGAYVINLSQGPAYVDFNFYHALHTYILCLQIIINGAS